jgi:hypothetical protein
MGGGGIVVGGRLTLKCTRREDAAGVPAMMAGARTIPMRRRRRLVPPLRGEVKWCHLL